MIFLYNEDCRETMRRMEPGSIDVILTSPPYNTSRGVDTEIERSRHTSRYEGYSDALEYKTYEAMMIDVFKQIDVVLKSNGVILLNLSYASNKDTMKCTNMINLLNALCAEARLDIADIICWKKKSALPNNRSKRTLTRIVEYIFVMCRKDEYTTFQTNKKEVSRNAKNYVFYENIYNFVEAKNNDGTCPYNKATYSSELCEKLLSVYCPEGGTVYDPFIGSGTTAVACEKLGLNCCGSEISENLVNFSENRIIEEFQDVEIRILRGIC